MNRIKIPLRSLLKNHSQQIIIICSQIFPLMASQTSISTSQTVLNPQVQTAKCRICLDQGQTLLKLCECSGSIAYVHQACIVEWIEKRIVCQDNMVIESIPTPMCEICKTCYSANIKINRQEISKELFCQNLKKLSTFNTLFTLLLIVIYFLILILMLHWAYLSYLYLKQHNQQKETTCIVPSQHSQSLDIFTITKYTLVWGLFPLHYIYTSIAHLKKMKHYLIDASKQIIADVTLIPKEILTPKCQDFQQLKSQNYDIHQKGG